MAATERLIPVSGVGQEAKRRIHHAPRYCHLWLTGEESVRAFGAWLNACHGHASQLDDTVHDFVQKKRVSHSCGCSKKGPTVASSLRLPIAVYQKRQGKTLKQYHPHVLAWFKQHDTVLPADFLTRLANT